MTTFDAAGYKRTTEQQWDSVAQHWNAWGPLLDRWLGPATETLLDMCGIGEGDHVLHVAGGSGQDAMQSARRVGKNGKVVSTDFSAELTGIAQAEFEKANLPQASAILMDGENIDMGDAKFDAVISRVGLIFFPDQDRAMAAQISALKPGGRVGALVYATPQECRFFSDPVAVIRRHAALPPPLAGQPGPFSLGAPGVIEDLFARAGLTDIRIEKVQAPVILDSAKDCLRFERESFGALHQMLGKLDADAKKRAWDDVETALEAFEGKGGFRGPCTMIAASGFAP